MLYHTESEHFRMYMKEATKAQQKYEKKYDLKHPEIKNTMNMLELINAHMGHE
jgi:hypothetical protein